MQNRINFLTIFALLAVCGPASQSWAQDQDIPVKVWSHSNAGDGYDAHAVLQNMQAILHSSKVIATLHLDPNTYWSAPDLTFALPPIFEGDFTPFVDPLPNQFDELLARLQSEAYYSGKVSWKEPSFFSEPLCDSDECTHGAGIVKQKTFYLDLSFAEFPSPIHFTASGPEIFQATWIAGVPDVIESKNPFIFSCGANPSRELYQFCTLPNDSAYNSYIKRVKLVREATPGACVKDKTFGTFQKSGSSLSDGSGRGVWTMVPCEASFLIESDNELPTTKPSALAPHSTSELKHAGTIFSIRNP